MKGTKRFYHCTACKTVVKANPSQGSKPMNTHADQCDPPNEGEDNAPFLSKIKKKNCKNDNLSYFHIIESSCFR